MKTAIVLAGLLWASSTVLADEFTDPSYDPYGDKPARPEPPQLTVEGTAGQESAKPGDRPTDRTSGVKESLMRKVVITIDGDEIGVINDVGYSAAHGEPVAVVDVDEFIGIGEKRIAIPLSQLQNTDLYSNTVTTLFTRDAVEAEDAFDEADFTAIE